MHVAQLAGVPAPVVRRAASLLGSLEKSGGAQISGVFVPNNNLGRRQAGGEQAAHNGGDHGGTRAGQRTGLRKNFYADGVVGLDEAAPRVGDIGGAGQREQAEVKGGSHARVVREKGGLQADAVHLDDANGAVSRVQRKKIRREDGIESAEQRD